MRPVSQNPQTQNFTRTESQKGFLGDKTVENGGAGAAPYSRMKALKDVMVTVGLALKSRVVSLVTAGMGAIRGFFSARNRSPDLASQLQAFLASPTHEGLEPLAEAIGSGKLNEAALTRAIQRASSHLKLGEIKELVNRVNALAPPTPAVARIAGKLSGIADHMQRQFEQLIPLLNTETSRFCRDAEAGEGHDDLASRIQSAASASEEPFAQNVLKTMTQALNRGKVKVGPAEAMRNAWATLLGEMSARVTLGEIVDFMSPAKSQSSLASMFSPDFLSDAILESRAKIEKNLGESLADLQACRPEDESLQVVARTACQHCAELICFEAMFRDIGIPLAEDAVEQLNARLAEKFAGLESSKLDLVTLDEFARTAGASGELRPGGFLAIGKFSTAAAARRGEIAVDMAVDGALVGEMSLSGQRECSKNLAEMGLATELITVGGSMFFSDAFRDLGRAKFTFQAAGEPAIELDPERLDDDRGGAKVEFVQALGRKLRDKPVSIAELSKYVHQGALAPVQLWLAGPQTPLRLDSVQGPVLATNEYAREGKTEYTISLAADGGYDIQIDNRLSLTKAMPIDDLSEGSSVPLNPAESFQQIRMRLHIAADGVVSLAEPVRYAFKLTPAAQTPAEK